MKRFLAIAGIIALGLASASAQVFPLKTFGHKSVQSGLDSLMEGYNLYDYDNNGNVIKEYNYFLDSTTYELETVNHYEYDAKNRPVKISQIDNFGDTLFVMTYEYTEVGEKTNLKYTITDYEDEDPMVLISSNFYGLKEHENFNTVIKYLEIAALFGDLHLCDSFDVYMAYGLMTEEEMNLHGIYSFDANGNPTLLTLSGIEFSEMPVNVNFSFTNQNNLINSMKVELVAMGGLMKIEFLKGNATYNNNGMLTEIVIEPVENEMIPAIFEKYKINLTYNAQNNTHCATVYMVPEGEEDFALDSKTYYVYKANNLLDSMKTFSYFDKIGVKRIPALQVTLGPNPVQDKLQISGLQSSTQVTVCDASGKLVLSQTVNAENAEIQMQSLSSGVYFVRLRNAEGVCVKKVVKQ